MFGSKIEREYRDAIREIDEGKRRQPRHQPPISVDADGNTLMTDQHRRLWDDFRQFGSVLDDMLQHGSWSIEEQPRVEIGWDSPDYGRNYDLYYNGYEAGELEIGVDHLNLLRRERAARIEINISVLQLIPYADARELLRTLSILFQPRQDGDAMRAMAELSLTSALTGHLWEVVREPDKMHWFRHRIEGPYDEYAEYTT